MHLDSVSHSFQPKPISLNPLSDLQLNQVKVTKKPSSHDPWCSSWFYPTLLSSKYQHLGCISFRFSFNFLEE